MRTGGLIAVLCLALLPAFSDEGHHHELSAAELG